MNKTNIQNRPQNRAIADSVELPPLKSRESHQYLWVLSGLALTACGGGGGGGLRITAPPPSPPINEGVPVAFNADIPTIRPQPEFSPARPARAAPVVILDEQQPSTMLNHETKLYPSESRVPSEAVDVNINIPMTLNNDGTVTLSTFDVEINDWEFSTPLPGGGGAIIELEVDNYVIRFAERRLTDEEFLDYLSSVNNGRTLSLEIKLTVPSYGRFADGNVVGILAPQTHRLIGVPQNDGSIQVTLNFYDDGNNLYFEDATGRTPAGSLTYTFDLDETLEDETIAAPDLSLIDIRTGDGYLVPIIVTNLARDGFGNARIVLDGRGGDSAQLRIDADGVDGDVYRYGHQWYKDGAEIERGTAHTLIITEAGTYRADVGIDVSNDYQADIWVETEEMRVLNDLRTIIETINSGGPKENSRIPTIQEHSANTAASVVILEEGANTLSDTFYYGIEDYTWDDGTFSNSAISDVRIPSITLHADGSATLPTINIMIDDWTLTSDILDGRFEVEIDNYEVQYDGITISDAPDAFDDSEASGRIISLRSIWTLSGDLNIYGDDGDFLGTINPGTFTIDGIPQSDGSIDIILEIYHAANGNIQFGSGQTLLSSETFTIDLNDPDTDDDEGPDISFLGVRKGNGYEVPTIITNLARDGFGNARVVADDGAVDSAPELLRIDADGVTGNVYADGHRWYKDGVEIQGSTAHTYMATEAGAYRADVAIDVDLDGHADIWVETPSIDIA